MNLLEEAKAVLRRSATISLELYKIMVPIVIAVKILQELGLISWLALPLAPVMQLVGLPGEMTTPIGRRVKGQLRGFNALVTGYTNHSIGYFPAAYQIIEGGYEVFRNPTMHPYSPEAEDMLIGLAMDLHAAAEPDAGGH